MPQALELLRTIAMLSPGMDIAASKQPASGARDCHMCTDMPDTVRFPSTSLIMGVGKLVSRSLQVVSGPSAQTLRPP